MMLVVSTSLEFRELFVEVFDLLVRHLRDVVGESCPGDCAAGPGHRDRLSRSRLVSFVHLVREFFRPVSGVRTRSGSSRTLLAGINVPGTFHVHWYPTLCIDTDRSSLQATCRHSNGLLGSLFRRHISCGVTTHWRYPVRRTANPECWSAVSNDLHTRWYRDCEILADESGRPTMKSAPTPLPQLLVDAVRHPQRSCGGY